MQGWMANSMERSEAAGAPWFAGDYSPEMLLRTVATIEDGRDDLRLRKSKRE